MCVPKGLDSISATKRSWHLSLCLSCFPNLSGKNDKCKNGFSESQPTRGHFLGVWRCKRLFRLFEDVESDLLGWGMGLHFGVPSLKTEMWRGGRIGRTKLRILRRESYADGVTMITVDFSVISNHQYSTGRQNSVLFSPSTEFSQKSVTISSPYLSEIWSSYGVW